MESGEETKLAGQHWWPIIQSSKPREKKVEELEESQSCETSEATDERKEVEEFPDLPKTEAGQVGLRKLESGEENKRSWAAVLKDQSCYTKEKKVEEEVKEPEEVSDPKKTEAQEEVLLKEEQVKEPEEASDPKQTPNLNAKAQKVRH
ncbi:hypothetical protein KUCAC02_032654 [Chaenocephalus aceratus]|nr:hypothetical protein KUCAC02_032654 [Chaenocephalus aceratus]